MRQFRGHRDGVWEVSVSRTQGHQVIATASAGKLESHHVVGMYLDRIQSVIDNQRRSAQRKGDIDAGESELDRKSEYVTVRCWSNC